MHALLLSIAIFLKVKPETKNQMEGSPVVPEGA
jgi:hypothetical protein